jgi:hypothetical protein
MFSSLADAINVIALSNARRSELEKDLDEARLQLREAKAVSKDFNAGRLFRLEIENAELQRDLGLHKVALEEARQTVLSNIQKANVDLPLQIESLRRDLATAEAALQCAETARDTVLSFYEAHICGSDELPLSLFHSKSASRTSSDDVSPTKACNVFDQPFSTKFDIVGKPPPPLAGIGLRLGMNSSGKLVVRESVMLAFGRAFGFCVCCC